MREYHGFLFGHYDSRGGTTFIEAENESDACKQYAAVMAWDVDDDEESEASATEELLGAAVIQTESALPGEPIDLDGGFTGEHSGRLWVLGYESEGDDPDDPEWGKLPSWSGELRIEYREDGRRPEGKAMTVRWDDDAYSFLFCPQQCVTAE
jgi:hypothetical protein